MQKTSVFCSKHIKNLKGVLLTSKELKKKKQEFFDLLQK